ncbi:MAG: type II toxin-antitoxin system HicA family toxin [Mesorhizobium sp.]|nr:MAG: type II toxin-antitoxin system HicA family toxin [Mesorhizobium sp.]
MCVEFLNSKELKKWLAAQGFTFESRKGGSGHLIIRRGDRKSELPMHGAGKELGTAWSMQSKSSWD